MKFKNLLLINAALWCMASFGFAQPYNSWDDEKVEVQTNSEVSVIMDADALFSDRWDILPQPNFWKQIMTLSPDSCLVNVASNRQILTKMSIRDWSAQSEYQKGLVKDSLKRMYGISPDERIYVTTGKNDFYRFKDVYPQLSRGIEVFEKNNVDPWYAQAILLIESPGQLKKSVSGAYGAFQLMPDVARAQGLIVNSSVDERKNFDRCAYGAARLISRVCVPEAKRILKAHGLTYNESDLWFRLFVLHVYHAGSMNVSAVVKKINPSEGSIELIKAMWQTSAAGFGNNSQNYTQLALAAQLILHDLIYEHCEEIYDCSLAEL
ncbi:MAG: hypothetical protein EP305_11305 [Bacteroidetes bacterium]|nr:MAG: hypothetical protein EP305_11305 [Bacteroidota bacterium]